MSLPSNAEAPTEPFPGPAPAAAVHDHGSVNLVFSTDSSDSSIRSEASTRAESVLKAADLSPDEVTSPLEALALACVAERATASEEQQPKKDFTENDVLCGRGGLTNNAPGNIFFRSLVRIKQESYLKASKREKAGVAREIVESIRSLDPPGRFLKKDSKGVWVEIGDRKAREKTSQALREGAPELRQKSFTRRTPETPTSAAEAAAIAMANMTHVTEPMATTSSALFHPRKFFKPDPTSAWIPSNRARVVSDDSVGIAGPLMQEAYAGSKRKVQDDTAACAMQEKRHHDGSDPDTTVAANQRGPRLKLLKSRLMV